MTKETTKKEVVTEQGPGKGMKGYILWAIVLLGYLIFAFNWMVMDSAQGSVSTSTGWAGAWFTGDELPTLMTSAVVWAVTIGRGIGCFFAGWVMVKIGHKKSVVGALAILSLGIFIPLLGLWTGGGYGAYSIFMIARVIMAIGGTTLIVYTQPLIAAFDGKKQREGLNLVNGMGFNVGTILAVMIFTITPLSKMGKNDWIIITSCISAIAAILCVVYLFYGEEVHSEDSASSEGEEKGYMEVIKEPTTLKFSFMYSLWLVMVVIFLGLLDDGMFAVAGYKTAEGSDTGLWAWTQQDGMSWWWGVTKILFLLGLFPGIPLFRWLGSRTDISRRMVSMGGILLCVVSIAIMFGIAAGTANNTVDNMTAPAIAIMVFALIAGIGGWGVQGVLLGTTYDFKGATPQKQGIMLGAIWGIGYSLYTVFNIILALVFDVNTWSGLVENADKTVLEGWVFFAIYLVMMLGCAGMWFAIPETRGPKAHESSIYHGQN